jgi:site-specific DNA-cytosine methylase
MEKTTLELFCGTKSFSKVADKDGYKTTTLDNQQEFNPTILQDILDIPDNHFGYFDIVWASPPCTAFSVAAIGKNWEKRSDGMLYPKSDNALLGIELLKKTVRLIENIKPKYWFIENPRGAMRKMPEVQSFHRRTVTYCQYGDTRMKPTDIWTNFTEWKSKPPCKNGDPCHTPAPRGSGTGTQGLKGAKERSVIPENLFIEIFEQLSKLKDNK